MEKDKEHKEKLASVQEDLQNYKEQLLQALQTIKERIPDIEKIAAEQNDPAGKTGESAD